uniref:Uncharacterized protein n=1 Tax=Rhizophora mucronata TaxID=61149 RepID=A0A2P2P7Z7_RHIMU
MSYTLCCVAIGIEGGEPKGLEICTDCPCTYSKCSIYTYFSLSSPFLKIDFCTRVQTNFGSHRLLPETLRMMANIECNNV